MMRQSLFLNNRNKYMKKISKNDRKIKTVVVK